MGAVTVERSGPVTTVRLFRPQARNAVDGPTAAAPANEFRHRRTSLAVDALPGAARRLEGWLARRRPAR